MKDMIKEIVKEALAEYFKEQRDSVSPEKNEVVQKGGFSRKESPEEDAPVKEKKPAKKKKAAKKEKPAAEKLSQEDFFNKLVEFSGKSTDNRALVIEVCKEVMGSDKPVRVRDISSQEHMAGILDALCIS